jgi:hypothetical protein
LLWREVSLKDFPKKFWDRSPLRWPPYPAIGITILTSYISAAKDLLNPSLRLKNSSRPHILLSRIFGFTSKSTNVDPILLSVSDTKL